MRNENFMDFCQKACGVKNCRFLLGGIWRMKLSRVFTKGHVKDENFKGF